MKTCFTHFTHQTTAVRNTKFQRLATSIVAKNWGGGIAIVFETKRYEGLKKMIAVSRLAFEELHESWDGSSDINLYLRNKSRLHIPAHLVSEALTSLGIL